MSTITRITTDQQNEFVLDTPEERVFLIENVSGDFVFSLNAPQAKARIYALFEGSGNIAHTLTITQIHNAPDTVSSADIRFIGQDQSSFSYQGLIRIQKSAHGSQASQQNKNLLLSDTATVALTQPSLEIDNDDVICKHGSATSRPDPLQLYSLESRGIPHQEAQQLIAEGFKQSLLDMVASRDI